MTSSAREHAWRDNEAEIVRRFPVQDELESCRLFDRQIPGMGTLENLVDEICGAAVQDEQVGPIRYETSRLRILGVVVNCRDLVARCRVHDPVAVREDERATQDDNSSGAERCFLERSIEIIRPRLVYLPSKVVTGGARPRASRAPSACIEIDML